MVDDNHFSPLGALASPIEVVGASGYVRFVIPAVATNISFKRLEAKVRRSLFHDLFDEEYLSVLPLGQKFWIRFPPPDDSGEAQVLEANLRSRRFDESLLHMTMELSQPLKDFRSFLS